MVSFSSFFRSNARRSALRVLSTVLLVTASIGLLAGCSDPADPIAVAGTWTITGSDWDGDGNDNVERWQISESTIAYDSSLDGTTFTTTYRADIVTYVNGSLNAGRHRPHHRPNDDCQPRVCCSSIHRGEQRRHR
jgi:hypothetical protein